MSGKKGMKHYSEAIKEEAVRMHQFVQNVVLVKHFKPTLRHRMVKYL